MIYNDKLMEFLERVMDILKAKGETIPDSVKELHNYCKTKVAASDFNIKEFEQLFGKCRSELQEMVGGGYIYIKGDDEKTKFFERMTNFAAIIINAKK